MEYRYKYDDDIKRIIVDNFSIDEKALFFLDSREGIILTDGKTVFKCLTLFNEHIDLLKFSLSDKNIFSPQLTSIHESFIETGQYVLHNYFVLESFAEAIRLGGSDRIMNFEVFKFDNYILLKMPYIEFMDYNGGHEEEVVHLVQDLKRIGWVSTDMSPKNLKIQKKDHPLIILIDIGYFFVPYYENLFNTMCRRAYISMKFASEPNIKELLRKANSDSKFSFLEDSETHFRQFQDFQRKIEGE